MRIFLVGLSEGFARAVARYVHGDVRVALSGVAPSIALAGIMLSGTRTALALVDWAALGASPKDSLQTLRLCCPGLVIACVHDQAAYSAVMLQEGADAVISKSDFAEELDTLLGGHFGARSAPAGGDHHA